MKYKRLVLLLAAVAIAATLLGCSRGLDGHWRALTEVPYGYPDEIDFYDGGICAVDGMTGTFLLDKDTLMISTMGQVIIYRYTRPEKVTFVLDGGGGEVFYCYRGAAIQPVPADAANAPESAQAPAEESVPAQSVVPDHRVEAELDAVSTQVFETIKSNTSPSFSSNRAISHEQLGISHSWMPGEVEDVVTAKLKFDTEAMRQTIAVRMCFSWNGATAWELLSTDFRVESVDFSPLCGVWESMDGSGHRITIYEAGSIDIAAGESETNVNLMHDLIGSDAGRGAFFISYGGSTASVVGMAPDIVVPVHDAYCRILVYPRELYVLASPDNETRFQRVSDIPEGALPLV